MSNRDVELMKQAEGIAGDYFPSGRVDPEHIAKENDITVSYGAYGDAFDGMLEHRSGRFHIYCNVQRSGGCDSSRARFTLSHELGHFFIDDHRNALASSRIPPHQSLCDFKSKNPVEREADNFAANLLMPTDRFRERAKNYGLGLSAILQLASDFGTSATSAAIRRVHLASEICAIIKWDDNGYSWKRLSTEARRSGFRKSIESLDDVQDDFATGRVLRGEEATSGEVLKGVTTASAWFPFVASGAWNDKLMIEQVVKLGDYGVLTLLFPHPDQF